jgi:hypothetical protein
MNDCIHCTTVCLRVLQLFPVSKQWVLSLDFCCVCGNLLVNGILRNLLLLRLIFDPFCSGSVSMHPEGFLTYVHGGILAGEPFHVNLFYC